MSENDNTILKFKFSFKAEDGKQYEGVSFNDGFKERVTNYKAYGEDVDLARRKQMGGDTIGLLYDPRNPKRVFLVDGLVDGV